MGLGNHDVDGGEHSGLLVGSCIQSCVPAWRGRGSPGGSRARSMPTRVAPARPCVSNKKSAGPAWQLCQALDGYSLSLPKRSINRSASKIARIKNQAIAKQSGRLCRFHHIVDQRSQFMVCWVSWSLGVHMGGCEHVVGQPGAERSGIRPIYALPKSRMQFGCPTIFEQPESRGISTKWFQSLKYGGGNCMRHFRGTILLMRGDPACGDPACGDPVLL